MRWTSVLSWISMVSLSLLVLGGSPVLADGPQTGTVDGRVVDSTGEPLPGVSVSLAGPQGQQMTSTNATGEFRFNLVNPGEYTVGATLEGLGSTEIEAAVSAGQRQSLVLRLRPETAETITVTAEAALIDKYAVGSTATLEEAVAKELTFKGRNYQSSFDVLPSVVHDGQSRLVGDIQFSVNGGNFTEVAGFVDGVDTSFARFNGSPRLFLPTTSLTETRLESAGFSVEYGRVVAGVSNAVVKSGTNQFHGDFLWIPQNQKWRAAYEALDIPREDEIVNSFETSLGGPIARDKVWFFASYAQQDTNEVDQLADGSTEDVGFKNDVSVLKLNFQPSNRHYISLLGIDSPIEKVQINAQSADRFSPCACDLAGEILTGTWGYSISSSLFLELKAADQSNDVFRANLRERALVAGASPDSPLGNNFSYQDRISGLRYNAIAQPAGEGFTKIPRQQANGSLGVFHGDHELKFGADYQDIEMETSNVIGKRYQGNNYNENLPGGFQTPQFVDIFDPASPNASTSDILSIYAQDRVSIGDKWTVYGGLRYDDQGVDNDIGEEAASMSEVAPRLSVTYDAKADGTFLVRANAGRYYQVFNQEFVSREFPRLPDGRNVFDRYQWNPATQRYDRFQRRFLPADPNAIQTVDPYYKDEVTAGIEWQFAQAWVFEAQAIWWELEDLYWASDQFNSAGVPYRDVRNWDQGFRDYRGVRLEANRAFRGGWTFRSNYTLGKANGNQFGGNSSSIDNDDLFEALGGVEQCAATSYAGCVSGSTGVTTRGREGVGPFDRKHNVNVIGVKQFVVGRHTLAAGGNVSFRSGERWGSRPNTTVRSPVSGQTINTSTYITERDANQMEDTYSLNLTGSWSFPIKGAVSGRVGVEVYNLTDEQEIISYNVTNSRPDPGKFGIQAPREIRFQAGITF